MGPLFAIHVLTALGAPLALFALIAGARGDWPMLFAWLGAALIVDAIDGPLARRFRIAERLPRWSGAALDLVVDYVTYVFLPAFAVAAGGLFSFPYSWLAAALIALTGAIYFADTAMKTPDGGFRGFPAVWNMVVFTLMVTTPPEPVTFGVIFALAAATFAPIEFVHPIRVRRWRSATLTVTALWGASALALVAGGLAGPAWLLAIHTAASVYLMGVGAVMQATRAE